MANWEIVNMNRHTAVYSSGKVTDYHGLSDADPNHSLPPAVNVHP